MTPALAIWLALLLLAAVACIAVAWRWHTGQESPRTARATLLIIAGLLLASIVVIAGLEPQP